jgi:hypothetical protein
MAQLPMPRPTAATIERKLWLERGRPSPCSNPGSNTETRYHVMFEGAEIGRWRDPECSAARWLVDNRRAARDDVLQTYRRRYALPERRGRLVRRPASRRKGRPRQGRHAEIHQMASKPVRGQAPYWPKTGLERIGGVIACRRGNRGNFRANAMRASPAARAPQKWVTRPGPCASITA